MALRVAPSSVAATPVGGSGGRTAEVNGIGVLHGAVLAHLKAGICTPFPNGETEDRGLGPAGRGPRRAWAVGRSRGGRGARSARRRRGAGRRASPSPRRRRRAERGAAAEPEASGWRRHGVRGAAHRVPDPAARARAPAAPCARRTRALPGRFPQSRQECNLETEKLCDYFSEHLGVYQPVLAALESLNRAVLTAMDTTKLEYERASKVDQFVTRFLLRETVSQLQALQSSLEGASDTLEAQARGPRSDEDSVEVQSRPRGSRRAGRRALRSVSWSPTWSPGSSDTGQSSEAELQWRLQVNRLQELIDQLECKAPRLEPLHEEELTKGPDSHILVAQRQMQVAEEALQDFHRALCCYVDFTGAQSHCLQHQQSACSKAFQRILIDHLRAPDTLTTVFFPASWWIMNNN
nr:N-terminal EF-hand calcium-binding protein 3 isoform X2 [Equus asinus]